MVTANPVFYEVLLPQSDGLPTHDRVTNHINEPVMNDVYDAVDENIDGFLLADDLAGQNPVDEFEFCGE